MSKLSDALRGAREVRNLLKAVVPAAKTVRNVLAGPLRLVIPSAIKSPARKVANAVLKAEKLMGGIVTLLEGV